MSRKTKKRSGTVEKSKKIRSKLKSQQTRRSLSKTKKSKTRRKINNGVNGNNIKNSINDENLIMYFAFLEIAQLRQKLKMMLSETKTKVKRECGECEKCKTCKPQEVCKPSPILTAQIETIEKLIQDIDRNIKGINNRFSVIQNNEIDLHTQIQSVKDKITNLTEFVNEKKKKQRYIT